jgi:hypothetical protein
MAYADDIASKVPPPDKLKGKASFMAADDGDEAPGETEADEDKAARVGMMSDVLSAMGVKATPEASEEACDALERYLDAAGYVRR